MAFNPQTRAEIVLGIRGEGEGVLDRSRQELARLKAEVASLTQAFAEGRIGPDEFYKAVTKLGPQLSNFTKLVAEGEAELRRQAAAMGASISYASAWSSAIAEGTQRAADFAAKLADATDKLNAGGQANAWASAIAEGSQKSAEFSAKLERQAAALDAATAKLNQGSSASAWGQVIAGATQRSAEFVQHLVSMDRAIDQNGVRLEKVQMAGIKFGDSIRHTTTALEAATAKLNAGGQAAAWGQVFKGAEERSARFVQGLKDIDRAIDTSGVSLQRLQMNGIKFQDGLRDSGKASTDAAYRMLHLGHALQDLQYGFGAVVNNIPLLVSSFGGSAGLAGALMMAGVGVQQLIPGLQQLWKVLSAGDVQATSTAVADLKAKLAELTAKPHKFAVDYVLIEDARKKLDEIEGAMRRIDALAQAKIPITERASKIAKEAVVEHGGATDEQSGAENLMKMLSFINEQDFRRNTPQMARIEKNRKLLEETRAILKNPNLMGDERSILEDKANMLNSEVAGFDDALKKYLKEQMAVTLDAFTEGKASGRKKMIETFEANRALFEKGDPGRGIAPVSPFFRSMLDEAAPSAIREKDREQGFIERQRHNRRITDELEQRKKRAEAEEAREAGKVQQDAEQTIRDMRRERDAEIRHEVAKVTQKFGQAGGPGSLMEAIQRRTAAGQSAEDVQAGLLDQMKGRLGDVKEDLRGVVAKQALGQLIHDQRLENAAAGPDQAAAARAALGADAAKAGRRDARDARAQHEQAMAEQIFQASPEAVGMQFTPEQATAAAHRAQQALSQGFNEAQAAMMGMMSVMEGLERFGRQMAQQSAQMQMGVRRLGGVQQAQPALMPVFGGGW